MKQVITALFLFTALGAQPALAGPDRHGSDNIILARAASGKSLDQAVAQVRKQTGGRILSAETVQKKGRTVYRIKVLTRDNKVRIIHVEAR